MRRALVISGTTLAAVTAVASPVSAAQGTFVATVSECYAVEPQGPLVGARVDASVTGAPANTEVRTVITNADGVTLSTSSSPGFTDATGAVSGFVMSGPMYHFPLELTAYVDSNRDGLNGPDELQIGSPVILPLVCPEAPPTPVVDPVGSDASSPGAVVDDLVASGALSAGIADSLSTRLEAAAAQADQGKTKKAVGLLQGTEGQVEGLIASGQLDAASGKALLGAIRQELIRVRKG